MTVPRRQADPESAARIPSERTRDCKPTPMAKLDRYLFREFTQSFLATLIVLLVVSLGGVMADLLGNIADGKMPGEPAVVAAGAAIAQLPAADPAVGADAGPAAVLRAAVPGLGNAGADFDRGRARSGCCKPLLMLVVPVVLVIGAVSLWLGPWADRTSERMIEHANRSLVVAGLDAGQVHHRCPMAAWSISAACPPTAPSCSKVFVQRQQDDRLDVVTARSGEMFFEGARDRYMRAEGGFPGRRPAGAGPRLQPDALSPATNSRCPTAPISATRPIPNCCRPWPCWATSARDANAQLHARIAPPLLALAFALMALPLARSSPRQARYGRIMLGFLAYLVGTNLMFIGTNALSDGKIPPMLGPVVAEPAAAGCGRLAVFP